MTNTDKRPSVSDISDEELLRRAVRSARSPHYNKGVKHMRWVAVKDTFSLGCTFSNQLCHRFDVNPDEEVSR